MRGWSTIILRPIVIARSTATKQSSESEAMQLDCFAAAQPQFILSDAIGGGEGLAMTQVVQAKMITL